MRDKSNYIIILGISILTLLITFSVLCYLFFFILPNSNVEKRDKSTDYQFTEITPFRSTSRKGFITLPRSLEQNDFLTYFNEQSKSTIIITHFGGSDYECSGSCYCTEFDENNSRRSSSQLLSRGLSILFSAFSVSMALKIAQETFSEECVQKYSEICKSETIESEVEQCELSSDSQQNEVVEDSALFLCKGYCLDFDDDPKPKHTEWVKSIGEHLYKDFREVGLRKFGLCEGIQMEKTIIVSEKDEYFQPPNTHPFKPSSQKYIAEYLFSIEFDDYCVKNSFVKNKWQSTQFRLKEEQIIQSLEIRARTSSQFRDTVSKSFEGGFEAMQEMIKIRRKGRPFCYGHEALMFAPARFQGGGKNINCVKTLEF